MYLVFCLCISLHCLCKSISWIVYEIRLSFSFFSSVFSSCSHLEYSEWSNQMRVIKMILLHQHQPFHFPWKSWHSWIQMVCMIGESRVLPFSPSTLLVFSSLRGPTAMRNAKYIKMRNFVSGHLYGIEKTVHEYFLPTKFKCSLKSQFESPSMLSQGHGRQITSEKKL